MASDPDPSAHAVPDPVALHDGDHTATAARYGLDVDVVAGLRRWSVAAGVIRAGERIVLVENRRRNGSLDWSTPGGVIDPGESPIEALTREVREETGLVVERWSPPSYTVEVVAPDAGFHLRVVAHAALDDVAGRIDVGVVIDDPDGIVQQVAAVDLATARTHLAGGPPWVAEPLLAHLDDGVDDGRRFGFHLEGADLSVARLHRV